MTKLYLSDPEMAKQMTTFVFDKEQLQKLQKDLLENPGKYEELLMKDKEEDPWHSKWDHGLWNHIKDWKNENLDYWHRFFSDGRNDRLENWPYRVEYYTYKDWADNIKTKALDTLKYTVSRLLIDFEDNEKTGNKVVNVQKAQNESKHASLNRIMTILNERDENVKP